MLKLTVEEIYKDYMKIYDSDDYYITISYFDESIKLYIFYGMENELMTLIYEEKIKDRLFFSIQEAIERVIEYFVWERGLDN